MNVLRTLPNLLSFFRIAVTPALIFCLWKGGTLLVLALIFFLLAALSDFYDGYVARKYSAASTLGSSLDPLADKLLVWTTFIAFYLFEFVALWMVIVIVSRDLFITLLRMILQAHGVRLITSRLAKWKTTVQFIAIILVLSMLALRAFCVISNALFVMYVLHPYSVVQIIMYLVVTLTLFSGIRYVFHNRVAIKKIIFPKMV